MFALPLNRTTRRRRLVCGVLVAGLLATGAGVLPASAQRSAPARDDTTHRYTWINVGPGAGRTGIGPSVAGGVPIADRFYAGGRYVGRGELDIFGSGPSATTWDAGPLFGLVEQGRWGHLSLASGVTVVGGRRPDKPGTKSSTLGIPLDVQAFFTPIPYVGIGVHGYANANAGDNLLGWSLQLQVRLPL